MDQRRDTFADLRVLQVIIKWRGKPVFVRHRTADEIAEANKVNVASLRDPETDDQRVQKPEWLVMLGKIHPIASRLMVRTCFWLTNYDNRCLHPSWLRPHRRGR